MTEPRNSNERYCRRALRERTAQLRREIAQGIRAPLPPRFEEQAA